MAKADHSLDNEIIIISNELGDGGHLITEVIQRLGITFDMAKNRVYYLVACGLIHRHPKMKIPRKASVKTFLEHYNELWSDDWKLFIQHDLHILATLPIEGGYTEEGLTEQCVHLVRKVETFYHACYAVQDYYINPMLGKEYLRVELVLLRLL